MEIILLACASFAAGFIDAVAGGGGIVLIPALFSVFPGAPPATLLGTNKVAAVGGTAAAAWRYARRVELPWATVLPAVLAAFVLSFCGAWAVTLIPGKPLRQVLPFVLLALLIYTVVKKDLGAHHLPGLRGWRERAFAALTGGLIGFYDGLFGPGTGSFLMFAFVRFFGFDFLHASAVAKIVNMATNLAAIGLFASKGHVWWHLALAMAVANIAGSQIGSRLALRHGSAFVRVVFIVVVSGLILKTAYDAFFAN